MARYLYLKWGDVVVTLTETEIKWIINELKESTEKYRKIADDEDVAQEFRAIANLCAENLSTVVEKLHKVYSNNHKRIAIR